jgi:hypothetical protein
MKLNIYLKAIPKDNAVNLHKCEYLFLSTASLLFEYYVMCCW